MPPCALHDTVFLVCDMTTLLAFFFLNGRCFQSSSFHLPAEDGSEEMLSSSTVSAYYTTMSLFFSNLLL